MPLWDALAGVSIMPHCAVRLQASRGSDVGMVPFSTVARSTLERQKLLIRHAFWRDGHQTVDRSARDHGTVDSRAEVFAGVVT